MGGQTSSPLGAERIARMAVECITQPRPAEEAKLQQGQKVFAREHIVKAGSSASGCSVPVGPSLLSSRAACSACSGQKSSKPSAAQT